MIEQHRSAWRCGDPARRFRFPRALTVAAAALYCACLAHSATVLWTGGGDGVFWHQAANWSNNILPTASDDVLISGLVPDITIAVADNVTVQSIQCSASLHVAGGNVSLTKGNSRVSGDFAVASGRSLTVNGSNTTFTVLGLTTLDGASLYAKSGAVLQLPGAEQAARPSNNDVTWEAEGAGSRLVLSGLTNLVGFASGSWWRFLAYSGGRVEMPAVTTLTNGWFQVYADGTGSVVDLSGLTAYQPSRTDQSLALEARNNGTVLVPQLTDGRDVTLVLRSGGTMPVEQLTRLQRATLDGVSVTFSNLATVDDTSLYVQNGAVLELPGIGEAMHTGNFDVTWEAEGAGSQLVLSGLTNLVGFASGSWWRFLAYSGGRVEMPAVTTLTNGWFQAYADATGSVVDLSGLTAYQPSRTDQSLALEARNNGTVLVPQLTDGRDVTLVLRSGGTMPVGQLTRLQRATLDGVSVTFSNLATVDDTSLYVQNGAVLELPGIGEAMHTGNFDVTWEAEGAGSRLVLSGLTNLVGFASGSWWRFLAYSGGRVEMPAVTTLTNGWFQAYADGTGSVVDLSGLTTLTASSGRQIQIGAKSWGLVDLHAVQSISGGSCSIVSDGTGSVIDLSSLSSFATPLGASELAAINGGTILLPGNAFVLVNVAVQIAGHPVLPPVVSVGTSVSLYGRAWHSYWVEVRDTRAADGPWQGFTRVAQTNDLQVIGGPPQSWQAFRVWEFMADPPFLDLHHAGAGQWVPVLFGATNKVYSVETAASLDALPAAWSPLGTSTGTMTNTFRILPAFSATEPRQFFRGKEE